MPAAPAGPEVRVLEGQWNKVYMSAAFRVPDLHSSKTTGMEVLGQLLGGDETSLLYRTFKYDKKLVDDISAFSYSLDRVGMFYISATLDADKAEQFWTELSTFMAGLDPTDFTDQELERAKLNLADSLFLAKETLAGLAGKLGSLEFLYGGQHVEPNYLAELARIGTDDLAALADEFLRPEALKACLLAPEGSGLKQAELTATLVKVWPVQDAAALAKADGAKTAEQVIELPGSSKLVLLPDATLPYTALSIFWRGGDSLLASDQQGVGALTAAALTRGTADMTATQIEDFLSDRAASMAAAAGRDTFSLSAKYPAWFSADMLGLVNDVLTGPSWPLKEIDLAKSDQIAAIHMREDKPIGLLFRRTFPFLFQDTHYRYLHQGEPEDVSEYAPETIRAYWQAQAAQPFVLAVCGTFDVAEMRAFAETLANGLTRESSEDAFAEPVWGAERDKTLTLPDRNQAHLLAAFPVPGTLDEEAGPGLQLLRAALAGQSGLLFRDLRDKQGLGYTVTALVWQAPETGFMAFYIGTDPEKLNQAKAGFQAKVALLAEKALPQEEIDRARNILSGEYFQEHQALLSRSREAASLMAMGRERTAERDLIERAQELTADDLLKLARTYLKWEDAYLIKVTP